MLNVCLYMQALKRWQLYMEQGAIPFLFDKHCNVLWNMGDQKKREVSIFLRRQIEKLESSIGRVDCAKTWMAAFGHEVKRSECA